MYSIFGKRLFDIVFVLATAIVLFPILMIVAALIKLFDPGPVIFIQKRVGFKCEEFKFYKFRSMPVDTGDIPSDQVGSVSITWVGKFIRRTNIDELPQLFNILKGDMSLVGPRPPLPSQNELIEYRRGNGAIFCKPGLTGLAQVSSFNGMTVYEKACFDGKYAQSITLKSDLIIILKTLGYLFRPPPVY